MRKRKLLLLSATLLLCGCASWFKPDVIAASCPPPPPAPEAVTGYASPQVNLIEDSGRLLEEFRNELLLLLQKASEPLTSQ